MTGESAVSGTFGMETANYLSFPQSDPRAQVRTSLSGSLAIEQVTEATHLKVQGHAMFSPGRWDVGGVSYALKPTWYAYVPEAFTGISLGGQAVDQGTSAYFGRRKQNWSDLEEYWQLGLWQPRFRWDCLKPESQGLTGLFLEHQSESVQWAALGTGLFIPEQGPSYRLENGRFSTESPCFEAPSSKLDILSKQTDIRYHVNMPQVTKVLFQPAGGATVRVGRAEGLWARASYAYKPMNHVFVDYDGYLQINQDLALVDLTPRVTYHHISTVEAGYQGESTGGWVSALVERPNEADLPWNLTGQEVTPSVAIGPTVTYRWAGQGEGASVADFGFLNVWGGDMVMTGPLAGSGSLTESHYAYRQVAALGLRSPLPGSGGRWKLNTRLRYDFAVGGNWVSSEARYSVNRRLSLGFGADVLSVNGRGKADTQTLISRFRGNDRIYGGVRYAF